jgi:orotidine-5'-phosphate decarboxylase
LHTEKPFATVNPSKGTTAMTDAKAVAKSLHTVTVIMQVAALHSEANPQASREAAISLAMQTLGLANRPDPYGLAAKALKLYAKK